jgi:hypothetical protein
MGGVWKLCSDIVYHKPNEMLYKRPPKRTENLSESIKNFSLLGSKISKNFESILIMS